MPGAFGPARSGRRRAALKEAALAEPGTDGRRPGRRGDHRRALHGRRRPAPRGRLRLRDQADHPAPPGPAGHRRGGARRRRRRPRSWPAGPTASSSPTAPATRPRSPTPATAIRDLLGQVPVFGICLGPPAAWPPPSAASTYKLPFGHHGGNHPVRRLSTGAVEITSQNHNYAVADGSVPGADVTHVNLNDGVIEGSGLPRRAGLQRAVPPRGRARARTTPATSSTSSGADGDRRAPSAPARRSRTASWSSAAGPIVIGQACEFDYSGHPGLPGPGARRAIGSSWPTPTRPRS